MQQKSRTNGSNGCCRRNLRPFKRRWRRWAQSTCSALVSRFRRSRAASIVSCDKSYCLRASPRRRPSIYSPLSTHPCVNSPSPAHGRGSWGVRASPLLRPHILRNRERVRCPHDDIRRPWRRDLGWLRWGRCCSHRSSPTPGQWAHHNIAPSTTRTNSSPYARSHASSPSRSSARRAISRAFVSPCR